MVGIGSHDNIVSLTGVVVAQRPWMVVLEFCIYGDLADVLTSCRRKRITLSLQEKLVGLSVNVRGKRGRGRGDYKGRCERYYSAKKKLAYLWGSLFLLLNFSLSYVFLPSDTVDICSASCGRYEVYCQ